MTQQYLTMGAAVAALEALASDEDEIEFGGEVTTPNDVLDILGDETPTEGLTVGFMKLDGSHMAAGTFNDLVADRLKGTK